jgi:hypothetical protein
MFVRHEEASRRSNGDEPISSPHLGHATALRVNRFTRRMVGTQTGQRPQPPRRAIPDRGSNGSHFDCSPSRQNLQLRPRQLRVHYVPLCFWSTPISAARRLSTQ